MELPLIALCVVAIVWQLRDVFFTRGREKKDQGDQGKRDRGELPYGYFKKEKRDGQRRS